MIINPIYLNSKNSEENDWNPYIMEEDKMLDLTDYDAGILNNIVGHSGCSVLYGDTVDKMVKVNANTTIILNMYNNGSSNIVFYFYGSDDKTQEVNSVKTPNININYNDYFKLKFPSYFIGKYLRMYASAGSSINFSTYLSIFIKDYDT